MLSSARQGVLEKDSPLMLQQEITNYLNWKASYTKKASQTYALHLNRFNQRTNKKLEDIDLTDVIDFQLYLKQKYSLANVAYSMTVIKNFFIFYKKQGRQCLDPFFIKPPKFTPHSHSAITPEEYHKMLKTLQNDEFYDIQKKLILKLLWETGMRVSELCDLNISDIDTQNPQALIITKKNNKPRWIFWTKETNNLLNYYISIRIKLNKKSPLFIASNSNTRITTRTVQRWIKEISNRADIHRKISPHSFRHAKAHQILHKSGTVKDIQFILGHSENNPISAFSYLRINSTEAKKRATLFLKG